MGAAQVRADKPKLGLRRDNHSMCLPVFRQTCLTFKPSDFAGLGVSRFEAILPGVLELGLAF